MSKQAEIITEEPNVISIVSQNIEYLNQIKKLTIRENGLLFAIGSLVSSDNCINRNKENNNYLTQVELAEKLHMSREALNRIISSLEKKGVFQKVKLNNGITEQARTKFYVNPNIMFFGENPELVSDPLIEIFERVNENSILKNLPIKIVK